MPRAPLCTELREQGLPGHFLRVLETDQRVTRHPQPGMKKGMATHSSIAAWRIPWTEEPSRYSPQGRKESDTTEPLSTHARTARKLIPVTLGVLG